MSEPFDFEAFIAGTQLARRKVSFYRVDHADEIARLTAEHDRMPESPSDERESSKSARRKLADRIAALRAEMEASSTDITIRTLTPDEFKKIVEDESADGVAQFALQTVEPTLTAEQTRRLFEAVGYAQAVVMMTQANDLIASRVAVPDFSQSVLRTLSPPESSPS